MTELLYLRGVTASVAARENRSAEPGRTACDPGGGQPR